MEQPLSDEDPPKNPLTTEEKVEKAFALKNDGNELFKANDVQSAIRKYHNALLYVKGLVSRSATLQSLGAGFPGTGIEDVSEETKIKINELEFLCYNNLAGTVFYL